MVKCVRVHYVVIDRQHECIGLFVLVFEQSAVTGFFPFHPPPSLSPVLSFHFKREAGAVLAKSPAVVYDASAGNSTA